MRRNERHNVKIYREPDRLNDGFLDELRKFRLIGIDGANSSGKSSLAKEIIEKIGGTHIEVDDHLSTPPNGRTYLQQVKFDELKKTIQNAQPPVIVDCFVLMDVLERLNMRPDLTLFCDREMNFPISFNSQMEAVFNSYKERRHPEQYAKQIFTLTIST
jgi:adenylate kinase family enzyme